MSRKLLKNLRKAMPNLTPEQVDAFDKFYANTPQDAFKTFATEEEFNQYKTSIESEATKPIQTELKQLKLKPELDTAKEVFSKSFKPSMWKYIQEKALNEDGTFNEKSKDEKFWKEQINSLDEADRVNYQKGEKETPIKFTKKNTPSQPSNQPDENGDGEAKTIYF